MIYLFLAAGFEEIETIGTIDILRRCGLQVQTLSVTGKRVVTGAHGVVVKADSLDDTVGDTVSHIKFGQGTVLEIQDGGRDFEVKVDFEKYGVKRMFASFAKLKKEHRKEKKHA